jgi:RHS repeat-associated protein
VGTQKGISGADINTSINSSNITNLINSQSNGTGTNPKAGLCWILFDEQLNYANAGFIRNTSGSGNISTLYNTNIPVTKSGYLYVYCSNESSLSVWFDNVQVVHNRGPLLEENYYYPHGLIAAGISSKALNFGKENKYKFNGYEQERNFDLNLYESFYRSHDPQLGRFWQVDPKPSDFESLYAAMGNNPVSKNDLLGDTSIYNEAGERFATYGPNKTDNVNYVIRTTKTAAQLEIDGGTRANPISTKRAKEAETMLYEASLWSEGDPGLMRKTMKEFKNEVVQIKNTEQMEAARSIVSKDDGTGGAKPENNREYGGNFTMNGASALPPGPVGQLGSGKKLPLSSPNGNIDFHSHPSGTRRITLPDGSIATYLWAQSPSNFVGADMPTAGKYTNYVFGMGSKIIYVFDKKGVKATLPLNTIFHR